jgi:hypothetical protein
LRRGVRKVARTCMIKLLYRMAPTKPLTAAVIAAGAVAAPRAAATRAAAASCRFDKELQVLFCVFCKHALLQNASGCA